MTALFLVLAVAVASCSAGSDLAATKPPPTATPTNQAPPEPVPVEPEPYIPSGPVGDAQMYNDMIGELVEHVPPGLSGSVPWPDLRNPDPVVAQQEIFELWIWMLENHPEPRLIDAIAAPGSPDRAQVASVFGDLAMANDLEVRLQAPYRTFDHRAIAWETAGLPLWLTRDVPEPAVVVYYRDDSGPATRLDRDTGVVVEVSPSPGVREWVSIIVETEVGWRFWRDTEITGADPDLEYPQANTPGASNGQERQNL